MTERFAPPLPPSYLPPRTAQIGRLIAVEGTSSAGKSTVVAILAARLRAQRLHVVPYPFSETSEINDDLAALPQLAFYLSGLSHAADHVRGVLATSSMVTDRYGISVIANHAAVHQIPLETVRAFARPVLSYLPAPEVTVYLRTGEAALRERMRSKADLTRSDRQMLDAPGLLGRLCAHYETLISQDPSALWIDTDRLSPLQIVDAILGHLAGRADEH